MNIFTSTLKRLFRNKLNLLFMLVTPSLMSGIIMGFGDWGINQVTLGLVDLDDTPLTETLRESIGESMDLVILEEIQVRSALAAGKVSYILVIQAGFTQDVIAGRTPGIQGYSIQESNMALPAKMKVESFVAAAKNIAAAAEGDSERFYEGIAFYRQGSFHLKPQRLSENGRSINFALGGIGLLVMNMMLLAAFSTLILLTDRENRTFFRVLTTPLPLKSYMLQSILCFLLISLIQIASVLLFIRFVFNIYLGPSIPGLFLVLAIFALVSVSIGVAIVSLAKNMRQAATAISLLVTPMSMLGGALWPREMMPQILQTIGQFMPTAWVMDAARSVMLGNPLSSITTEISILLAFALVFFLLGTWRQVDVSR
jgi:ABC-2 type transport system permease protein